ncbi:uncharacterized protein LOC100899779 [Galendromus occidentalis]|uniref:Uncharacterized protein LOC100899779 n=1 Tax=Galendromus occidentalis TaxID=34638 RepID=A0AAJ7P956_9ACAR|nr:uncharacterized protein LOC100899779 [Galendromus occidentalis]
MTAGWILFHAVKSSCCDPYGLSPSTGYQLPDGVELLIGGIRTTFRCPAKYGYYADVDNDCKLFHVCNPMPTVDNRLQVQHYSFLCGNQTVFNQLTLTCAHEDESIPCENAPDFFYVNDNFGREDEVFLTNNDVESGYNLYTGFGRRKSYDP